MGNLIYYILNMISIQKSILLLAFIVITLNSVYVDLEKDVTSLRGRSGGSRSSGSRSGSSYRGGSRSSSYYKKSYSGSRSSSRRSYGRSYGRYGYYYGYGGGLYVHHYYYYDSHGAR